MTEEHSIVIISAEMAAGGGPELISPADQLVSHLADPSAIVAATGRRSCREERWV